MFVFFSFLFVVCSRSHHTCIALVVDVKRRMDMPYRGYTRLRCSNGAVEQMTGIQMHEINSLLAQPLLDQLRTRDRLREGGGGRRGAGARAAAGRGGAGGRPR